MLALDLTLSTPAENLALDEALLELAEAGTEPREALRLWEPGETMVVVGRASRLDAEVDLPACRRRGVPIYRRSSGGAAIVAGPGCLMHAVVLSLDLRPELRSIDAAHRFVLDTLLAGLKPLLPGAERSGTSDLSIGGRKFSGNSLRVKRGHLLYHGTLLYDFAIEAISECLTMPPRQPEYRQGREHGQFVANAPLAVNALRQAVRNAWAPRGPLVEWPRDLTLRLAAEKYRDLGAVAPDD